MPVMVVAKPKGGVGKRTLATNPAGRPVFTAPHRLTLFNVAPGRGERDLQQWQPLTEWLST